MFLCPNEVVLSASCGTVSKLVPSSIGHLAILTCPRA